MEDLGNQDRGSVNCLFTYCPVLITLRRPIIMYNQDRGQGHEDNKRKGIH